MVHAGWKVSGVAVALMAAVALGCGVAERGNAFSPTPAFVEGLRARAASLAETEMRKFNEMERMYKDRVVFNAAPSESTMGGVYYKGYRVFERCEVSDIVREDSYVLPIAMHITFHYKLYTTPPRHSLMDGSAALVQGDSAYSVLRERHVRRVYLCDSEGNYAKNLPDTPELDNIYTPSEELVVDTSRYPVSIPDLTHPVSPMTSSPPLPPASSSGVGAGPAGGK